MKRAFERHKAITLWVCRKPIDICAPSLSRIPALRHPTWKYGIGKADRAQSVRQLFAFGNAVEIGNVPELLRLLGQRLNQMRMRVSECIDGNAGGKIEVPFTFGREQPCSLASLEGEVDPRIGWQ